MRGFRSAGGDRLQPCRASAHGGRDRLQRCRRGRASAGTLRMDQPAALAAEESMRPKRETTRQVDQTYFVSSQTAERLPLFRHLRWAELMADVLGHYAAAE